MRNLMLAAALLSVVGCATAQRQCKTVKVAYWQDKNEPEYKYKVSYLCELPSGATETVTPIVSKSRIPAPASKCK